MFKPSVPLPEPVDAVTVRVVPDPGTLVIAGEPPSPAFANAKSVLSTPVTDSLNVTVQSTDAAFEGVEPTRTMELTVGAVRSSVYTWPVKFPFPAPDPPNGFVAASTI